MRQLNDDELRELSAWEPLFRTAVNASWASNPGRVALERIAAIYTAATGQPTTQNFSCGTCVLRGQPTTQNFSCGTCVLRLLQDTGRLYFAAQAAAKERKAKARKK